MTVDPNAGGKSQSTATSAATLRWIETQLRKVADEVAAAGSVAEDFEQVQSSAYAKLSEASNSLAEDLKAIHEQYVAELSASLQSPLIARAQRAYQEILDAYTEDALAGKDPAAGSSTVRAAEAYRQAVTDLNTELARQLSASYQRYLTSIARAYREADLGQVVSQQVWDAYSKSAPTSDLGQPARETADWADTHDAQERSAAPETSRDPWDSAYPAAGHATSPWDDAEAPSWEDVEARTTGEPDAPVSAVPWDRAEASSWSEAPPVWDDSPPPVWQPKAEDTGADAEMELATDDQGETTAPTATAGATGRKGATQKAPKSPSTARTTRTARPRTGTRATARSKQQQSGDETADKQPGDGSV